MKLVPYFGLRIKKKEPNNIEFHLDRWSNTYAGHLVCPKCPYVIGETNYKWHKACKQLEREHIHAKCGSCGYEFGASTRDN